MLPTKLDRLLLYCAFSVAIFCLLPSASAAQQGGPDSDAILVRSRLALPGGPVQEMFLGKSGGRDYLYISQAHQAGYVVVDVTDDRHPTIIKEITLSRDSKDESLEMIGAGLGIAGRPDNLSQSSPAIQQVSTPPQFVRLLDLSNPSHPRTLKTFDGVTSMVLDDRQNMIYLANGDGLWILHHRVDTMRQVCQEESGYSPVPMMCTGY